MEITEMFEILRGDIRGVNTRVERLEERVDARLLQHEERVDARLLQNEERVDARLQQHEERVDARLLQNEDKLERRMTDVKADLGQRISDVRTELVERLDAVNDRIDEVRTDIREAFRSLSEITCLGAVTFESTKEGKEWRTEHGQRGRSATRFSTNCWPARTLRRCSAAAR